MKELNMIEVVAPHFMKLQKHHSCSERWTVYCYLWFVEIRGSITAWRACIRPGVFSYKCFSYKHCSYKQFSYKHVIWKRFHMKMCICKQFIWTHFHMEILYEKHFHINIFHIIFIYKCCIRKRLYENSLYERGSYEICFHITIFIWKCFSYKQFFM